MNPKPKVTLLDLCFEASTLILVGLGIAFVIVISTIDNPDPYGPHAKMLQSLVITMGFVMGICAISTVVLERQRRSKYHLTR